jgi:hypothetical protein
MARLEDLTRGASLRGILPDGLVTVVDIRWHGSAVVELTYKDATGRLGNELLYRDSEPTIEVVEVGRPWSFDGDGALLLPAVLPDGPWGRLLGPIPGAVRLPGVLPEGLFSPALPVSEVVPVPLPPALRHGLCSVACRATPPRPGGG